MKKCLILISCFVMCGLAQAESIPASLIKLGDGAFFSSTALVVDKAARTISVWEATADGNIKKQIEFKSDLGKKEGPKHFLNDHKTPEGVYFLETLLEGPQLYYDKYGVRAFTTNYPNLFDRIEGRTGYGIWLHAIPDKETLERGSRGCVVVRNEAILQLSKFIKLSQTPIIIESNVKYVDVDHANKRWQKLSAFLEKWRKDWESKSVDQYISNYSDRFEASNMKKQEWKRFKQGLYDKYTTIQVQLSQPVIYEHEGYITVRFLQKYTSDLHTDFGEKTLYLVNDASDPTIISEEWRPLNNKEIDRALTQISPGKSSASN